MAEQSEGKSVDTNRHCAVCGQGWQEEGGQTLLGEAGADLAAQAGEEPKDICPRCLESRGLLSMMYCREFRD
ncbi:MAG TPA: hypothetical protein VFR01_05440 [Geobacterales bacterium]|nr:hypothetical protein [Geobacterales bacterium]